MTEKRAWERRDDESDPAWEAFRVYLMWGSRRTLDRLCKNQGKSHQLISGWASKHEWRKRCMAFDSYAVEAPTDGMVHALAESRDKNLALIEKLRTLLSLRLDVFMDKMDDPTVRWTQALVAMAKIEENVLLMNKDSDKTPEKVAKVEAMLAELDQKIMGRMS